MARTPEGLASGTLILGSNLIYTTAASTNIIITNLTLTNIDTSIKSCDIYINRALAGEQLFDTVNIVGGIGKSIRVNSLQGLNLNATDTLSITASAADINYDLSGYTVVA